MIRLVRVAGLGIVAGVAAEALLHAAPQVLPAALQRRLGVGPHAWRGGQGFYDAWHALAVADALAGYRYAPHLDVRLSGHPDFSYRLRTNGRGLRTPFERGPVDVIALGDSFTFGYGVDEAETWPARLAELTGWSVANLGVSGYGPQSELALLRSEGPALQPRLLLWQFFANDLEDASLFARWQQSGDPDLYGWQRRTQAVAPAQPAACSLRSLLHRHVRSYELVKYLLHPSDYPAWVEDHGAPLWLDLSSAARRADFARPENRDGWRITCDCLLQAKAAAEAAGAPLAVLLAPSKEEIYAGRLRARQAGAAGDLRGNTRRVAAFCRQQSIACLDLGPAFVQAAQAGQAFYFRSDAHWNPAGHALAAQQVARWLADGSGGPLLPPVP